MIDSYELLKPFLKDKLDYRFSTEQLSTYINSVTQESDCEVQNLKLIPLRVFFSETVKHEFCVSLVISVKELSTADCHNVVITFLKDSAGNSVFYVLCSDQFLEGEHKGYPYLEHNALKSCESAAENFSNKSELVINLMKNFKSLAAPKNRCEFFRILRFQNKFCIHATTALAYLRDNRPDFMAELEAAYNDYTSYTNQEQ